ncbi:mctp-related [Schistosoma mansoni]|uniref:mctp-related n=1 Tax=Schistosoma mansoni TaxID=6183 RepID=UPI0001A62FC8|nr:mctp-related [Schistosoma mansoni]|eukprot:XP_018647510.1 mctp-related [Schistosoma mansoni]
MVGTLSNISDIRKKSDEINVSQNEERTGSQSIERQLDETITTKFSISSVTINSNNSSIDCRTEIKSCGDDDNVYHNQIKNEAASNHCQHQHQNNHHQSEINATNEEIPVSPSSLTGQSSSFSHLNTSSPMSYGDELNSIPVTSSIDDLLSLDQYDQDDGKTNPYVKIKHNGSVLARSRMIPNSCNPVWDEKFWFRLWSLDMPIELKVYHRDPFKKDSYIGRTQFGLVELDLDKEYEFISKLENDLMKTVNSGEIKFYVTLSEISETFIDNSECKKLKKKMKEEKSRVFATEFSSQLPGTNSSTLIQSDNYSVAENIGVPIVRSGIINSSVTSSQQSNPQSNQSNHDSTEIVDSTEDLQNDDGQPNLSKQGDKSLQNRIEDNWTERNQSLLPQPIWPYNFYEGTSLELYTSKCQGDTNESIDKLYTLNNEIQMESLFQQSRLIVTLVGAKNLKVRTKLKNVVPVSEADSSKTLRGRSTRSHSDHTLNGLDEEKNNLPCPTAFLTVGTKTHQSKVVMHTRNPLWNERFEFRVRPGMRTVLQCEVFDDSHQNTNLLGRFYLDFSKIVLDWTTCFKLNNQDGRGHGEIHILATMTGLSPISNSTIPRTFSSDQLKLETDSIYGDLSKESVSKTTLDQVAEYYAINRASNLPAKDRSGKSNVFCEIRLVNRVVRTFTAQKNANPVWNQAFVFPIEDMYSVLEVYIYEEGKESSELTGCISFPLIQLVNRRQKWYALKDKSLTTLAKGSILLQTIIIFNPVSYLLIND